MFANLTTNRLLRFAGFALFLGLCLGLYLYGANQQYQYINTNPNLVDQSAYMNAATKMRESNFAGGGGRNRMPLYPFLLSFLYSPGMETETFFALGKTANILLSLLILLIFAAIFRKYLPLWPAVNLWLITLFTVFIFKAAFVQVELLFYFFSFVTYLLLCQMLRRPTWKLGVVTGVMVGLTHLTKASILPALLLFTAVALLKILISALNTRSRPAWQSLAQSQLLPVVLVLFAFLLAVWPYIRTSKEQFGHYFYNVNSTFYMWYDSWEEAEQGTKAHGDREHWPDMPPEEIPSAAKYFREHSALQIKQRLHKGVLEILANTLHSYGYFKYGVLYFVLLVVLMIVHFRYTAVLIRRHFYLVLFIVGYFAAYLLLYTWFAVIMAGNRLILAQFLPFMFTASYAIFHLYRTQLNIAVSRNSPRQINIGQWFNIAISLILVFDVYLILTNRINTIFGGL